MKIHTPPHIYLDNTIYFISVSTYKKQKILANPQRRDSFLTQIHKTCRGFNFKLFAWVINPDHYHLLFKTSKGTDLTKFFHHLHGLSASHWNKEDRAPRRKVWQNYFDTCIRDKRRFYLHLNYIHYNPVKHGYVSQMEDYHWSSYRYYLKKYGIDWLWDVWTKYPIKDFIPVSIVRERTGI